MFTKNTLLSKILIRITNKIRPSEDQLRKLSRKDRPGLDINLPPIEPSTLEKGRHAFQQGEYAEALHLFSLTTKSDPNNAWGWHGRGDALQLLGDYKGALSAYEKAISLQPHTALHYGGKANTLRGLQRHREFEVAKQRALELDASVGWLFSD